jgi:hypothetical protein
MARAEASSVTDGPAAGRLGSAGVSDIHAVGVVTTIVKGQR